MTFQNHSVAQSDFAHPCTPISSNQPSVTGFYSGFMPVTEGATQMATYSVYVKDEKPIWFYCSQGPHCQKGMSGAINS